MFQEHKGVKMKAKKFIEKTIEGEYELIKNHVIEITEEIAIEDIVTSFGIHELDNEDLYDYYGVIYNEDNEIYSVDVNRFIKGIKERIKEIEEDEYVYIEKEDVGRYKEELKKLEKYKDYDIYL